MGGNTSLLKSACLGYDRSVELLLQDGAAVNVYNEYIPKVSLDYDNEQQFV